jgi:hypothetical protein
MKHYFTDMNGQTHTWETPDTPTPLDGIALIATLNAVLGIWSLTDAANIANVSEQDLVHEAQAWAVGGQA